jgi:hypothetical protein
MRRARLGQFMTPSAIATFMASLFQRWPDHVRLLDPGAGIGSLSEAFARRYLENKPRGTHLNVTAYEIESVPPNRRKARIKTASARPSSFAHSARERYWQHLFTYVQPCYLSTDWTAKGQ